MHLQFARPTLDAYCSTKCAFVNQIGLTGKHTGQILRTLWKCSSTIEYWPTFSNSNRHYCDHHMFHFVWQLSPNVGASISRWQLGNYRPQYHCIGDWKMVDAGINLTRRAWTKLTPTSETKLNQVHLDQIPANLIECTETKSRTLHHQLRILQKCRTQRCTALKASTLNIAVLQLWYNTNTNTGTHKIRSDTNAKPHITIEDKKPQQEDIGLAEQFL